MAYSHDSVPKPHWYDYLHGPDIQAILTKRDSSKEDHEPICLLLGYSTLYLPSKVSWLKTKPGCADLTRMHVESYRGETMHLHASPATWPGPKDAALRDDQMYSKFREEAIYYYLKALRCRFQVETNKARGVSEKFNSVYQKHLGLYFDVHSARVHQSAALTSEQIHLKHLDIPFLRMNWVSEPLSKPNSYADSRPKKFSIAFVWSHEVANALLSHHQELFPTRHGSQDLTEAVVVLGDPNYTTLDGFNPLCFNNYIADHIFLPITHSGTTSPRTKDKFRKWSAGHYWKTAAEVFAGITDFDSPPSNQVYAKAERLRSKNDWFRPDDSNPPPQDWERLAWIVTLMSTKEIREQIYRFISLMTGVRDKSQLLSPDIQNLDIVIRHLVSWLYPQYDTEAPKHSIATAHKVYRRNILTSRMLGSLSSFTTAALQEAIPLREAGKLQAKHKLQDNFRQSSGESWLNVAPKLQAAGQGVRGVLTRAAGAIRRPPRYAVIDNADLGPRGWATERGTRTVQRDGQVRVNKPVLVNNEIEQRDYYINTRSPNRSPPGFFRRNILRQK